MSMAPAAIMEKIDLRITEKAETEKGTYQGFLI